MSAPETSDAPQQAEIKTTAGTGGLAGVSVRRPWLAIVTNLLIVIAGLAAYFSVEVRELPNVDRPVVSVRGDLSGASPTTVDAEVTSRIEAAVARISGVSSIRAASEEGNFRVRIEFQPSRDLDSAASDVREAVARAERRLPDAVENLTVVRSDADAQPIVQIAVWSDTLPVDVASRAVEDSVLPVLTAVDGVAEVTLQGARRRELSVEAAPERLAALGVSISDLVATLEAAEFDVPVGSFAAENIEVLVRADASVVSAEEIEALVIRDDIRIGDVASVFFSPAKATSLARLDGRLVLNLSIVRRAGSNTVAISEGVERAIEGLRARFPDLNFAVTSDDAVFIRGAIGEVITTLGIALAIVVGVIWLFLGRLGPTLAPAVAIPVALIGALAAIQMLGFSVNMITLLALVLATGLVVDDAIVVLENIQRKRSEGLGRRAAAVIGAREVFFAVIATTATLVAVFTPISFLPGAAGRLFTEFGFLLSITVIISSFVALSLTPMIAARLPSLGEKNGGGGLFGPRIARGLGGFYAWTLRRALAAPLVTVVLCALLALGAAALYGALGEELTPTEDRGAVVISLSGPDGAGVAHTDRQVAAVEAMAAPFVASGVAQSVYSVSGRWDPNRGFIYMQLAPWDARTMSQAEIEAALRGPLNALPGARARIRSSSGLGLRGSSGTALSFAITGPSHDSIAEVAFAFAERLEQLDALGSVRVDYQATQPQLSIELDRQRVSDLNADLDTVGATLRALVDERQVADFNIGDEIVPVVIRSTTGAIQNPSDLLNFTVRTNSGALVPLEQFVGFVEEGVPAQLDRLGQRRAVMMSAGLSAETPLREAVELVRAEAAQMLPDGFGLVLSGEAATLEDTSNDLALVFAFALVIAFLVLVAQFESLTSALIVLLTAPFGVAAAIFALWMTGVTINIYSQIGVLMLIGVMAKNGILMVEFADQLRDRGAPVWQAAAEAARIRLRPITMTLLSTVLAGLPLVYGDGPGAEARASIGWVIFGGLGLGAFFTLFLTPAVYVLIAGWTRARAAEGAALEAELAEAENGRKEAVI